LIEKDKITLDIDKYREEYCKNSFGKTKLKDVCQSYLEGLQWIISYYKKGVPDWKWYYPYNYAPPANIISEYILKFKETKYKKTYPLSPFEQLLCVLPPKSSHLLPKPLDKLLTDKDSSIKEYYPDEFEIDLAGKKNDWQGVVIIPMIDPEIIKEIFLKNKNLIDEKDMKRNILGKSFIYTFGDNLNIKIFKSYYGDIYNYKVINKPILL
jgi:5'-3' exonuclease